MTVTLTNELAVDSFHCFSPGTIPATTRSIARSSCSFCKLLSGGLALLVMKDTRNICAAA